MTPNTRPDPATPGVLAGQILKRFDQVLARHRTNVPDRDCPVSRAWRAETGSELADFPGWLAARSSPRALVKVIKLLNAPPARGTGDGGAGPGAEVLLQMALLALVQLLAQRYASPLQSAAGPLLHLPMLEDTVLALLVACRHGVAVHLAVRYDSQGREQLVVTNLITDREEVQVGMRGVQDTIDTERRRKLLAQQVMHKVLPPGSGVLGQRLPDDQMRAWVEESDEDGMTPIVVLAWDEADLAHDIVQRLGVRAALRGDPAKAPADSPHRAQAQHFADAGQQVEPYFADLARLLRPVQVAPVLAPTDKPLIFVSYARADLALQLRLCTFLRQYKANVSTWTDQDLQPGQDWQQSLLDKLAGCQLAVLLLSVDFNVSEFIGQTEMPEIQRRHAAGQLQVVPVIAGHCDRTHFPWVNKLQWPHPPEQPLLSLDAQTLEKALQAIAKEILELVSPASKDTPA